MNKIIDFPRMIYHVVLEPLIVKSEEELNSHIEKGWCLTPVLFDEIKALKAKIAFHESEAARLQEILDNMDAPEEVKEDKFVCEICHYEAKSNAGLSAHSRAQHKEVTV